jgi:hypothetical protein
VHTYTYAALLRFCVPFGALPMDSPPVWMEE